MKTFAVIAAVSAGFATAQTLSPPENFPDCGTTCFNNMLGQSSELGCGNGGTTADAVDGPCLCRNIDFTYGIIDCANQACPEGAAPPVVQYGIDWCAAQGVVVGGLTATPDSSLTSSASATITGGGTVTGTASATTSIVVTTTTDSDGSTVTSPVSTLVTSGGESGTGGVVVPISTTEIVSTVTNSDGDVVTTTVGTSTIFSTSATDSSATESATESATDSTTVTGSTTFVTESTSTASDSTTVISVTTTAVATSTTPVSTDGAATSTESDGGAFQTAVPVSFVAALGLAALLL